MSEKITHLHNCSCGCNVAEPPVNSASPKNESRRDFFKLTGALSLGLLAPPAIANAVSGDAYHQKEIEKNNAIRNGKAQRFTILHTSDIHAQLYTHDEFFLENNKPVYKKRGGFAVLKTMLNKLRAENPANTILIDGGDCFQGGGVGSVAAGDDRGRPGRTHAEGARRRPADQAAEHGLAVEAGDTQPVDGAVGADKCRGTGVTDQAVVLDGPGPHDGVLCREELAHVSGPRAARRGRRRR